MSEGPDDPVAEGARRIAGRVALKRASAMVQGWQAEERENARLARQRAWGLLILTVAAFLAFFIF